VSSLHLLVLRVVEAVLAWSYSAASLRPGSMVEAVYAGEDKCSASGSWLGSSLRRLAAARSVAPSGLQGCRATLPMLLHAVLASLSPPRPKWPVPQRWCGGQSSVASSDKRT
jgi:hypothetical protein